jgi:hypothetical protein
MQADRAVSSIFAEEVVLRCDAAAHCEFKNEGLLSWFAQFK